MALNLDAMRAKLDKLNGKGEGAGNKNLFWRPEEGESNIRIVSTADGDPFKERFFHYGVGNQSFLCPKRNFGDDCPVCNFANQLWNEGTEESKKQAKEMITSVLKTIKMNFLKAMSISFSLMTRYPSLRLLKNHLRNLAMR